MKFPWPRPLFPELVITPADEEELAALVTVLVDQLVAEEHTYRVTNEGQVDTAKWKHIRQTENATVYHGREERPLAVSSPPGKASPRALPSFLVVGKVTETLDDLLYSFTAPTRESAVIKSVYVDNNIADTDILHTITRPTADAPFSQLNIKWMLLVHSPIFAPRDYIFIDAHGTRVLPSGERVGYRVSHSIELTGAGPLADHGCVRSNFSTTVIYREDTPHGHVHEYGHMFVAPAGAIPNTVFVSIVARTISTSGYLARLGEAKKLALALRHKYEGRWTVAVPAPPFYGYSQRVECGVCTKTLNLMNKSRLDCALCTRRLCVSCRIRKDLVFVKADLNAERLRVTFCTFCVQQAVKLPSHDVAAEEYLTSHDDGYYRMPVSLRAEGAPRGVALFANLFYAKEEEKMDK